MSVISISGEDVGPDPNVKSAPAPREDARELVMSKMFAPGMTVDRAVDELEAHVKTRIAAESNRADIWEKTANALQTRAEVAEAELVRTIEANDRLASRVIAAEAAEAAALELERPVINIDEATAKVHSMTKLINRAESAEAEVKRMREADCWLLDVYLERARQDRLWGVQNHPIRHPSEQSFYQYEVDTARANYAAREKDGSVAWVDILREEYWEVFVESDPLKQRKELVHLTAVAVAMIECLDRRAVREDEYELKAGH